MRLRDLAKPFAPLLAALSFALTALGAPAVKAEPALWVVKGPHSTVYLFGTIHMLKDETGWMTPKIKQAFDESSDLTLEIADLDDDASAAPLVAKLGLDLDHPLSSKLPPRDRRRLAKALVSLKADPAAFERLQPWLAALTLSILPVERLGYDPKAGVDLTLNRAAKARGEPINGFETLEQQLGYFAGMPEPQQIAFLRETLRDLSTAIPDSRKLEADWEGGRVEAISREVNEDMRREDPKLYDLLIVRRNQAFAAAIAKKLEGSGVSFVAVGAGHLAGVDSVQVQLAKLGYKAERL